MKRRECEHCWEAITPDTPTSTVEYAGLAWTVHTIDGCLDALLADLRDDREADCRPEPTVTTEG